jgi:hypothetical protein
MDLAATVTVDGESDDADYVPRVPGTAVHRDGGHVNGLAAALSRRPARPSTRGSARA